MMDQDSYPDSQKFHNHTPYSFNNCFNIIIPFTQKVEFGASCNATDFSSVATNYAVEMYTVSTITSLTCFSTNLQGTFLNNTSN